MAATKLDFPAAFQQLLAPYTPANGAAIRVQATHVFGLGTLVGVETLLMPHELPADATAEQTRSALMESANQAIGLVEAFGFRHYEAPRIDFTGRVLHRMDMDPFVVTECVLRLNLYPPKAGHQV